MAEVLKVLTTQPSCRPPATRWFYYHASTTAPLNNDHPPYLCLKLALAAGFGFGSLLTITLLSFFVVGNHNFTYPLGSAKYLKNIRVDIVLIPTYNIVTSVSHLSHITNDVTLYKKEPD